METHPTSEDFYELKKRQKKKFMLKYNSDSLDYMPPKLEGLFTFAWASSLLGETTN